MLKRILIFVLLTVLPLFAQDHLLIESGYVTEPNNTLVYTPSDYKTEGSYPAVFMLHGYSGDYTQWSTTTDPQYYADEYGFIIILLDGYYDSWYVNSPVNKSLQYHSFFFEDLAPLIFSEYSIDKKKIFVTGLSMGGYGAITLFQTRPDFFRSAGSTSGVLDITQFPDRWGMEKVFGKFSKNRNNYEKYSPVNNLDKLKNIDKQFIIDCGVDDIVYDVNAEFYQKCKDMNIPAVFISQPGKHSHSYWKHSIKAHFLFFKELSGQ